MLDHVAPNPMATLSFAIALAMVRGPESGLAALATLDDDARVSDHHRLYAVRGHLLEMAGDRAAAREAFQGAMRRSTEHGGEALSQEQNRSSLTPRLTPAWSHPRSTLTRPG